MERMIAPVVHKRKLNERESDFAYWQQQPYEARIKALEEIRAEYHAWLASQQKDGNNVQPGFQRVYRIIKRK
jgi:hypothetical protein